MRWHLLHASAASTILLAMGLGCVANWIKNCTLHCAITAPILLAAGIVFLLSDGGIIHVQPHFVWPFVIIGVGIAFLVEWTYSRRQ